MTITAIASRTRLSDPAMTSRRRCRTWSDGPCRWLEDTRRVYAADAAQPERAPEGRPRRTSRFPTGRPLRDRPRAAHPHPGIHHGSITKRFRESALLTFVRALS